MGSEEQRSAGREDLDLKSPQVGLELIPARDPGQGHGRETEAGMGKVSETPVGEGSQLCGPKRGRSWSRAG